MTEFNMKQAQRYRENHRTHRTRAQYISAQALPDSTNYPTIYKDFDIFPYFENNSNSTRNRPVYTNCHL